MKKYARLKKQIGFIGCGNMGSAILKGILFNKIASPKQIVIFDADASKMNLIAKQFGVRKASSNQEVIRHSQVILLAIKPQEFSKVAAQIRRELKENHLVISILAGTPIVKIKKHLGAHAQISRAMPNLGAVVSEGITAVTSRNRQARSLTSAIFSGCGKVIQLEERYFDWVTAVSGSGPAYFFLLMELLSQVAQKGGLSKSSADLLAIQTAAGAARLAQTSSARPAELRHMVTSKKGTTEAALQYLSKKNFGPIFIEAVHQAMKRAKQLSKLA